MTRGSWTRVGDLIPDALTAWKKRATSPIHKLRRAWKTAVGPDAAARSFPISLRKRILLVAVESAVWEAELATFDREKIIGVLNKALGSRQIDDIRFTIRRSGNGPADSGS